MIFFAALRLGVENLTLKNQQTDIYGRTLTDTALTE